jgi:uncharacterized membrane protein HdeD (DUF308 family)
LILASGIISLVAGIFALMSPVTATVFVVTFLSCALIVVGVFSMLGVFFTEQHYRCPTFVMGAAQLALGICMLRNIVTSMVVLTGIVAVLYMILGVFHCFLACGNTGMPGYGSYLTSGICSILFSVIVLSAFPTSSVYTLGIILGVNWVTSGIFRIAVGFSGRSEAKTLMSAVPGSIV